jgi:hypothetical protein
MRAIAAAASTKVAASISATTAPPNAVNSAAPASGAPRRSPSRTVCISALASTSSSGREQRRQQRRLAGAEHRVREASGDRSAGAAMKKTTIPAAALLPRRQRGLRVLVHVGEARADRHRAPGPPPSGAALRLLDEAVLGELPEIKRAVRRALDVKSLSELHGHRLAGPGRLRCDHQRAADGRAFVLLGEG